MRKKIFIFLIFILASNDIAYGKHGNDTNIHKQNTEKTSERTKRSSNIKSFLQYEPSDDDGISQKFIDKLKLDTIKDDSPFWGSRGRRESLSLENSEELPMTYEKVCSPYSKTCLSINSIYRNDVPFWGNRGRRYDSSSEENSKEFWDDRVRRQEEDDPFWGSRGRRTEDEPFWGSRGRRLESNEFRSSNDDETPFWGNRGRRKMNALYNEPEPFWGSRGKKNKNAQQQLNEEEPFWATRGKRYRNFDDPPKPITTEFENNSKLSRLRDPISFWANRGRDSKLKHLFTGALRGRDKARIINKEVSVGFHVRPSEQNTIQDDRIYAEEPHYILIERSSRSSSEDDPYIITRGKKYGSRIAKAARDRRGALEDIVRSVQKDPYYIARGKKNSFIKIGNTIMALDSLNKDKVCSMIQSLQAQGGNKRKREVSDPERDRRAILQKLAAKLQEDPFFVSRGKKDKINEDENIQAFADIADMCS
ncbi:uncharacterized protein LOC123706614 [Pieris brassicae]|uniref:Natalisin n=1 Tax=Pieris brassicae TaxID=7116 RepID=A0A9P0XFW2_PIEBR|nr:uncharacterized protein LOC123706614 [Pieris brassicae]CAH4034738.1 unnamed protein product [Pieris brassicae]